MSVSSQSIYETNAQTIESHEKQSQIVSLLLLPFDNALRLSSLEPQEAQAVLRNLLPAHAQQPALLALTGVPTNTPNFWHHLGHDLDNFAALLDLNRNQIVALPDVHHPERGSTEHNSQDIPNSTQAFPGWPRWRHLIDFYSKFYQTQPELYFISGRLCSLFKLPDTKTIVVGVTLGLDSPAVIGLSQVEVRQAKWLEERLAHFQESGWLRVGILHEHSHQTAGELQVLLQQYLNLVVLTYQHANPVMNHPSWLSNQLPVLSAQAEAPLPSDQPLYQWLDIQPRQINHWQGALVYAGAEVGGQIQPAAKRTDVLSELDQVFATFPHKGEKALKQENYDNQAFSPLTTQEKTDDFLSHVATVCRLREQDSVDVKRIPATEFIPSYLRICVKEGEITRLYPLCACEGHVSTEIFEMFCLKVVEKYRQSDPSSMPVIVYGGDEPVPNNLRQIASQRRVRIFSFVEYQGLIDFRWYLKQQTQRLQANPQHPPQHYVPQPLGFSLNGVRQHHDNALETLEGWLGEPYGRCVFLLGDTGIGKSALLHALACRLVDSESHPMPLLIELPDLIQAGSLENLLAYQLGKIGLEHFDVKAFHYMVAQGHIALLLDGFDELALYCTDKQAQDYLENLLGFNAGHYAKIIISFRSQYFRNDDDALSLFPEQGNQGKYRLAWLEVLPNTRIKQYLQQRLDSHQHAEQQYHWLSQLPDLLGLAENPRMLRLIMDLPVQYLQLAEQAAEGGDLHNTLANLYSILVRRWLEAEQQRAERLPHQAPLLTLSARWQVLLYLAQALWQSGHFTLSMVQMGSTVQRVLWACQGQQNNAKVTYQAFQGKGNLSNYRVGADTLMTRSADGQFSLLHPSLLSWLVARQAAQALKKDRAVPLLYMQSLDTLGANFLIGLTGKAIISQWARRILASETDTKLRDNAQLLQHHLGEEDKQHMQLAGQNLCGHDLSERHLRDADFRKADLSNANFHGSDLSGANFSGAQLRGANLSHANLQGAMLQGAMLDYTNFCAADLRDVYLDKASLQCARLIGTTLGNPEHLPGLESTQHFGAAGINPTQTMQPMLSSRLLAHAVVWHPNGLWIASAGNRVSLWDVYHKTEVRHYDAPSDHIQGTLHSLCFSPDGYYLLAAGDDRNIYIWAVESGDCVQILETPDGTAIRDIKLSKNGKWLASACWDRRIRIWRMQWGNIISGALHATLDGHENVVRSLDFHPEKPYLISAGWDKTVRLWNLNSNSCQQILKGHSGFIRCVYFSPDGHWVVSSGSDKRIRFWRVDAQYNMSFRFELKGHKRSVNALAFSPDMHHLYSAADDRCVKVWRLQLERDSGSTNKIVLGALIQTLKHHRAAINDLALRADHKRFATVSKDGSLCVWPVLDWHQMEQQTNILTEQRISLGGVTQASIQTMAISPTGDQLVFATADQNLRLWNWRTGHASESLVLHTDTITGLAFSPDGKRWASCGNDQQIGIWDAKEGKLQQKLSGHDSMISGLVFSPDGSMIASAAWDKTLRLWDLNSDVPGGLVLACLVGHRGFVRTLDFSPCGTMLASGASDHSIRLWHVGGDPIQGEEVACLEGHKDVIRCLTFSQDGQWLATGSDDKTVRLWWMPEGAAARVLKCHSAEINGLAFSPDGQWLASVASDGRICLWNMHEHSDPQILRGHLGAINGVKFSKDGQYIFSAGTDNHLNIWSLNTKKIILTLSQTQQGWVTFRPDGHYRAVGDVKQLFWHVMGLCRFSEGEVDAYLDNPLRLPNNGSAII